MFVFLCVCACVYVCVSHVYKTVLPVRSPPCEAEEFISNSISVFLDLISSRSLYFPISLFIHLLYPSPHITVSHCLLNSVSLYICVGLSLLLYLSISPSPLLVSVSLSPYICISLLSFFSIYLYLFLCTPYLYVPLFVLISLTMLRNNEMQDMEFQYITMSVSQFKLISVS